MTRNPRTALSFVMLVVTSVLVLDGCTHVRPYERGVLSKPTMTPGSVTGTGEEHLFEVHEGASGGGTAGGGGCGCN